MGIKKNTYFYLVRHGQTDWNIEKKVQGQADIPLNTVGEAQASQTAQLLEAVHLDRIWSSDLCRAYKTAEIIKADRNTEIILSEKLRERDYRDFNGYPSEKGYEIEKALAAWEYNGKLTDRPYPDVESDEELSSRLTDFLRGATLLYPGETSLIVTHAGPLRRILTLLGYVTEDQMPIIQNAAYLKLRSNGVDFFIEEMNGISK